ncbi:MAG: Fe-S cluster assembly protein SufD [Myxococcota bacterium]|nr:Fe-S cluster assembly protein SufD [Myxococcota bacterium]
MGAPIQSPTWASNLRAEGREHFERLGYPSRKHEAWRYTSTRGLQGFGDGAATAPDDAMLSAARDLIGDMTAVSGHRLVLVNGHLCRSLSTTGDENGLVIESLDDTTEEVGRVLGTVAPAAEDAFVAMNTSHLSGGVVIRAPKNVAASEPIEILHVQATTEGTTQSRVTLIAESGSELSVIERHIGSGDGASLNNGVTEISVGPSATVNHVKILEDAGDTNHVGTLAARVERDGTFNGHLFSLGGTLGRTDLKVSLAEPGASCSLDGLYAARDGEHYDHYVVIDHQAPHTTSAAFYKGVVDDGGLGGFVGRVLIREGASGSNSEQMNRNLLLAPGGTVHSRPQLEIDHDDVKASHGSTVGELDQEAIFYLKSRGLEERMARAVLTWAFAREMVNRVPFVALRGILTEQVALRLSDSTGEETLQVLREAL